MRYCDFSPAASCDQVTTKKQEEGGGSGRGGEGCANKGGSERRGQGGAKDLTPAVSRRAGISDSLIFSLSFSFFSSSLFIFQPLLVWFAPTLTLLPPGVVTVAYISNLHRQSGTTENLV